MFSLLRISLISLSQFFLSSSPTFVGYFGLPYRLQRSFISHSSQMSKLSQLLSLNFPCHRVYLQVSSYCVVTYTVQRRDASPFSETSSQFLNFTFCCFCHHPAFGSKQQYMTEYGFVHCRFGCSRYFFFANEYVKSLKYVLESINSMQWKP